MRRIFTLVRFMGGAEPLQRGDDCAGTAVSPVESSPAAPPPSGVPGMFPPMANAGPRGAAPRFRQDPVPCRSPETSPFAAVEAVYAEMERRGRDGVGKARRKSPVAAIARRAVSAEHAPNVGPGTRGHRSEPAASTGFSPGDRELQSRRAFPMPLPAAATAIRPPRKGRFVSPAHAVTALPIAQARHSEPDRGRQMPPPLPAKPPLCAARRCRLFVGPELLCWVDNTPRSYSARRCSPNRIINPPRRLGQEYSPQPSVCIPGECRTLDAVPADLVSRRVLEAADP